MNILRLINRYIKIDLDYIFNGRVSFFKIIAVMSVNLAAMLSLIKINVPAYINNRKIISDKPLTIKTFLAGIYDFWFETRETNIFDSASPLIIDVGANVGQFAIACKANLPKSIVHSFEPDPETFELLEKNTDKFNNVFTNNLALSDKIGHLKFYKSKISSEWSSLVKPFTGETEIIHVQSILLDDYVKEKHIKSIDLLKVDVEGAEVLVLKGARKALKLAKYVIVEVSIDRSEPGMRSSDVLGFLFDAGYEIDSIGRIFREKIGSSQSSANILLRNINRVSI